jgi:hypothetical protein
MTKSQFKTICDSEEIGNLYGVCYYPDNIPIGDSRLRTVSVFARFDPMAPQDRQVSFSITPDFEQMKENVGDSWGWRTCFNTNTPHSDLVRKFDDGQGTEEELLKLIHIFKKGYKETLIKDKITTIEKDFV